jgi:hypothetical protein
LTVTGFNAFRSDPQLKQIRIDLADRAEKTTVTGAKGVAISCPDAQLQMALRGVVRAIDQLPELTKPHVAAVEGSEATIEAFRRLTTTFFGLLTFMLPPAADELRELQHKAMLSVEGLGSSGAPAMVQAVGLAKRDYVPLAVAIFVDLCLLLVSIGRPVNQFMGLERSMREAEDGPVYPILARFHDIHADSDVVRHFEVFRDVIFDLNGHYHVAVPLNIPKRAENYAALEREAHRLANLCYALEGKGILSRPMSFLPGLLVQRQLKRRASKFVECYGRQRPARYRRGWDAMRSVWSETPVAEKPAFKVYRFKRGAWPEMILGAVMGASRNLAPLSNDAARPHAAGAASSLRRNGHAEAHAPAADAWSANACNGAIHKRHEEQGAFGHDWPTPVETEPQTDGPERDRAAYGDQHEGHGSGVSEHSQKEPALSSAEGAQPSDHEPRGAPANPDQASPLLGQLRAWAQLLPGNPDPSHALEGPRPRESDLEPQRIASRFVRPHNGA